jgi:Pectate lyase superfamily protein
VTGSGGSLNCASAGTNQNITLTPSGTGASVITRLQDKGGQVFNVKAYGAAGDGAADDSPAFAAALAAAVASGGGTIEFPPAAKCYRINSTLNLTNLAVPITLHGNGKSSAVCGNTGLTDNGAIIDESGSGGVRLENMSFVSDTAHLPTGVTLTNPSQIGILYGRTTTSTAAQHDDVINSYFFLPVHASGSPSFGWYNCGSELDTWVGGNVQADNPVVLTLTNQYNLNSTLAPWVAQTSHSAANCQSTTEIHMLGTDFQSGGLGPAIEIDGATDVSIDGHVYNLSQGAGYSSSLAQYAIQIDYWGGMVYNLDFNFRQEGYPGFLIVKNSELKDSRFQGSTMPGATPASNIVEFTDNIGIYKNLVFHVASSGTPTPVAYDANQNVGHTGVAVLDNVTFDCGAYTNCGNIPVGLYQPGGWTLYASGVHYSGNASNPNPTFVTTGTGPRILDRLTGSAATVSYGSGAPTGSCVTPSLYLRTDGGSGSTLYVCESSAWVAK